MSILIAERELPLQLSADQAVEAAYATELAEVASKLQRGLPTLIECDKDLAPYLFKNLRDRLRGAGLRCIYLDGRPRQEEAQAGGMPMGLIGTMIAQLRDAVRGQAVERRVVVLPHLDLLTTSQGILTSEAREAIPLLYENPELVWLGFKDPSFSVPQVIENLFPHRLSLLGIARPRLRHLITQKESRKFGREFNPWALYKHVSGVNAVRLRRLLSTLEGEDYPADPRHAYRQVRQATLGNRLEVPNVDLNHDIGGYTQVKERLRAEILDVLAFKDKVTDAEEILRLEELLPKGMIFWGPPGTGKTLFAKAMATAIGAAITVVSGPELKNTLVGESEKNLRQIFHQARQSAPSIIVFDELDSFATTRGTYTGSGVEHSMVNQLLTEMDGFHKEELVFVVGTTNLVNSLDPALLRPGRFEFHLEIPYPDAAARRAILQIYDRIMHLEMSAEALEWAVKRTRYQVPGAARGTEFSGDHLNALCRAIARARLRKGTSAPTSPQDIDTALTEWIKAPPLTTKEQGIVAIHEAGHAVCQIMTERSDPIERISLQDHVLGAIGYVAPRGSSEIEETWKKRLDRICISLGAREAEWRFFEDFSRGSAQDLAQATGWARELVQVYGLGGEDFGIVPFWSIMGDEVREAELSQDQRAKIDQRVQEIVEQQRQEAKRIIKENAPLVATIAGLLLARKPEDGQALEGQELADRLRELGEIGKDLTGAEMEPAVRELHRRAAERVQTKLNAGKADNR